MHKTIYFGIKVHYSYYSLTDYNTNNVDTKGKFSCCPRQRHVDVNTVYLLVTWGILQNKVMYSTNVSGTTVCSSIFQFWEQGHVQSRLQYGLSKKGTKHFWCLILMYPKNKATMWNFFIHIDANKHLFCIWRQFPVLVALEIRDFTNLE